MAQAGTGAGRSVLGAAKLIALLLPAALLGFAHGSEHWGMVPCEMCWWQRYGHYAALLFAIAAFMAARFPDRGRSFVWLAALAILTSGAIGFYHAGVELKYFPGFTQCTTLTAGTSADDFLNKLMDAPIVRCDDIQFKLLGISMAGWNAILSIGGALVILWLSLKRPRNPDLA